VPTDPIDAFTENCEEEDYSLAQKDKPYRCLDLLLKHRDELFQFLKGQWSNLFGVKYDVLLPIFMRTSLSQILKNL